MKASGSLVEADKPPAHDVINTNRQDCLSSPALNWPDAQPARIFPSYSCQPDRTAKSRWISSVSHTSESRLDCRNSWTKSGACGQHQLKTSAVSGQRSPECRVS